MYKPSSGVTNGDSHDHSGGDGAQIDHTTLSNIGSNTHAQTDTKLSYLYQAHLRNSIIAPNVGLTVKNNASNPTYQVDIDADELILFDSSGNAYRATNVNLTIDLTVSGANGLESGSEAVSTWYHIGVAWNGSSLVGFFDTDPAIALSGYDFMGYVGAIYNDAGGDLDTISQVCNLVTIPTMLVKDGGTDTSYTSVDLSAVVPVGIKECNGFFGVKDATGSATMYIASDANGLNEKPTHNPSATSSARREGVNVTVLTDQTLYYKVNSGNTGYFWANGWSY